MQEKDSAIKLNEPIFSKKKSLLTIGQYAATQGVSAGVVQECARLGVVQVRKHKDKTFIVDLPLDIYKIIKEQDSQSPQEVDVSSCADKISDLVNRIFQPDSGPQLSPAEIEIIQGPKNSRPDLTAVKYVPGEPSFPLPQHKEPDAIPDLQLFAEEEDRTTADENKNQFAAGRFRIPLLRSITESIMAVSTRRLAFIIMTAAFFVSLCAYTWVSMDRKFQREKLQQAYESINKLTSKFEDTRQRARLLELDMMNWRSEADRSKNALMNSESELQSVRKSLSEARKDLENMKQYNTEALKELNDKITRIRSNISNVSRQTPE